MVVVIQKGKKEGRSKAILGDKNYFIKLWRKIAWRIANRLAKIKGASRLEELRGE